MELNCGSHMVLLSTAAVIVNKTQRCTQSTLVGNGRGGGAAQGEACAGEGGVPPPPLRSIPPPLTRPPGGECGSLHSLGEDRRTGGEAGAILWERLQHGQDEIDPD